MQILIGMFWKRYWIINNLRVKTRVTKDDITYFFVTVQTFDKH